MCCLSSLLFGSYSETAPLEITEVGFLKLLNAQPMLTEQLQIVHGKSRVCDNVEQET